MKTTRTWTTIAGSTLGCVLGLTVALAAAQAAPQEGEAEERAAQEQMPRTAEPTTGTTLAQELTSTTATVKSIDRENRQVTLRSRDGEERTIDVPEEVTAFDRLKKGDQVNIEYYEALAVSLAPPGTEPGVQTRTSGGREAEGAMVGRQVTVTAEVVEVDADENTVVFKGANGKNQKVKVSDPRLQARLPDLSKGDKVQLTYTEAVAASISPTGAKKKNK